MVSRAAMGSTSGDPNMRLSEAQVRERLQHWHQAHWWKELSDSLTNGSNDIHFACGGAIQIRGSSEVAGGDSDSGHPKVAGDKRKAVEMSAESVAALEENSPFLSGPVTIRWDSLSGHLQDVPGRITFPVDAGSASCLDKLLHDMQPATFGLGGKDVLDERYRKAHKMDTTEFCTTFNPYEVGIIDIIAQTLLPNAKGVRENMNRTVRAELYKLNVYSAPSGRFRAHVDTPRGLDHFGTLVVCLPVAHEGGELQVRHGGREQTFDWGNESGARTPSLQWAAFYSDCEHEVLEVRAGHRVTLTYNLYVARGTEPLAQTALALNPTQLPFYSTARGLLVMPYVLPEGGFMGFYTVHSYPHTSAQFSLADSLKGVDMVIWQSFKALGCEVSLRPVIGEDVDIGEQDFETDSNESVDDELDEELDDEPPAPVYIGAGFGVDEVDGRVEGEYDMKRMLQEWAQCRDRIKGKDVTWINRKGHEEPQIRYTAYGNEPEAKVVYSCCAILVKVAAYSQRIRPSNLTESLRRVRPS